MGMGGNGNCIDGNGNVESHSRTSLLRLSLEQVSFYRPDANPVNSNASSSFAIINKYVNYRPLVLLAPHLLSPFLNHLHLLS